LQLDHPLIQQVMPARTRSAEARDADDERGIVGVKDLAVEVGGLDALDGSPVIDLKPTMRGFPSRDKIREPAWASEIMKGYW